MLFRFFTYLHIITVTLFLCMSSSVYAKNLGPKKSKSEHLSNEKVIAEAKTLTPSLAPYTQAPDEIPLSKKEQDAFNNEKAIYKEIEVGTGKRGIAIFKVNASAQKIWATIHSFPSYPEWIKGLRAADIYRSDGENIFVHFQASHWLLGKTQWYVHHSFPSLDNITNNSWGSWTLDYNKASDFRDSVGFWQVIEESKQASKVIYSVDLLFKKKTSAFIRRAALKRSLKDATQWVKEQAEN